MYKVLQYNLNNRIRQKVVKKRNVYISSNKLDDYRRYLANLHGMNSVNIYLTVDELSTKQIIALKKSLNLKKKRYGSTKKIKRKNHLVV